MLYYDQGCSMADLWLMNDKDKRTEWHYQIKERSMLGMKASIFTGHVSFSR